jgi:pyruvate dehydrogenase E2 component (dihydrolipoamide acetyltransferase)
MHRVSRFTAIINPPQAIILAVGAAARRPVVRGDRLDAATTLAITLSGDHRAIDGATGARFIGALQDLLESPARLFEQRPVQGPA